MLQTLVARTEDGLLIAKSSDQVALELQGPRFLQMFERHSRQYISEVDLPLAVSGLVASDNFIVAMFQDLALVYRRTDGHIAEVNLTEFGVFNGFGLGQVNSVTISDFDKVLRMQTKRGVLVYDISLIEPRFVEADLIE